MPIRLALLLIAILALVPARMHAQESVSRADQGWYINPYGRIHILFVFAEMVFDSSWAKLDPEKNPEGSAGWKVGRMPFWREKIASPTPDGDGFITKYFRQASFGRFQVTGDFLDTLVRIPISTVRDARGSVVTQEAFASNHYRQAVLRKLNAIPNPRFRWGSTLEDFDRWTFKGQGMPNDSSANGRTDIVMVIWRNIHVAYLADASGFVSPGSYGKIWGRETDMHSVFHAQSLAPKVIMRHEFSHMLYGGNNFHTAGGGVGQRCFLGNIGGWSNMSASDACAPGWNAYDRERLAWRPPGNAFTISARCPRTGDEVNGIIQPGTQPCGDGVLLLRDFASTGDALKIPLPHLPGTTMKQYLWIENHQRLPGYIDHERAMLPGLYAYIQVGKDATEGPAIFGGDNNYIWPLPAAGQYDFRLDSTHSILIQESARENPFTGYHYLMRHPRDKDRDGEILITPDNTVKSEHDQPRDLIIDGVAPPDSFFTFERYPMFGTRNMAFAPGANTKIGLGTNPAATPLLTHGGPVARSHDNRRIYLNGLSIELLGIDASGTARIRIRWDDYAVDEDRRWCGDIVLNERIELRRGRSIRLAQGYSPQVAERVQVVDGQSLFAEPTVLEARAGSTLSLEADATLLVERGSSLLLRKGSKLVVQRGARIVVEDGAWIHIEDGADLGNAVRFKVIKLGANAKAGGLNPIMEKKFAPLGAHKL